MHSVPPEILQKILSNLSLVDRVRSRLVCHQWKKQLSLKVVSMALVFCKSGTNDCELSLKLETQMGQRATVKMNGQQKMESGLGGLFQFCSSSLRRFAYQMVRGYASQCPEVMNCQLSVAQLAVQHLTPLESVAVVGRKPSEEDESLQQLYSLLLGPQLCSEATRSLSLPDNGLYAPLSRSAISTIFSAIQPGILHEVHLSLDYAFDNVACPNMPFSVENALLERLAPQLQRLHLKNSREHIRMIMLHNSSETYEWMTFPQLQHLHLSGIAINQCGSSCPLHSLAQWAPQLQSLSMHLRVEDRLMCGVWMFCTDGPISYSQLAQACPRLSHLDIDGIVRVRVVPVECFSWPTELPKLCILRPQLPVEDLPAHPSTLIEGNVEVLEGEEEKRVERERVKSSWALWDMQIT